jgi:hypothetical protein
LWTDFVATAVGGEPTTDFLEDRLRWPAPAPPEPFALDEPVTSRETTPEEALTTTPTTSVAASGLGQKLKGLPLWLKITVPVVAIVLVVAALSAGGENNTTGQPAATVANSTTAPATTATTAPRGTVPPTTHAATTRPPTSRPLPTQPPTTASPSEATMATATVKAAGISLNYPKSWILVPLTKSGLAAMLKVLSTKNPKLAAGIAGADVSQFKFRAIDTSQAVGQNVGVQLIQGGGSPSSLSDLRSGVLSQYKSVGGTVLDTTTVKVSGKTAYRVDLTLPIKAVDGTVVIAREGQLVIPEGDNTVVVTVSVSNDDPGVALINTILASVRRI